MAATLFVHSYSWTGCCCLATQPPTQKLKYVVLLKSTKPCISYGDRSQVLDIWEACQTHRRQAQCSTFVFVALAVQQSELKTMKSINSEPIFHNMFIDSSTWYT